MYKMLKYYRSYFSEVSFVTGFDIFILKPDKNMQMGTSNNYALYIILFMFIFMYLGI